MNIKSICILTTGYPKWPLKAGELPNGKYVHDMAVAFVKAGYRVYVVTHNYEDSKNFQVQEGVEIYRFNYLFKKWQYLKKGTAGIPENLKKFKSKLLVPLYFLVMFLKTINIIRKKNVKIINAHWAVPTGFIAVFVKFITQCKLITTVYGAELFPVLKSRMKFLQPFIKYALNKADNVAGISKATVDSAIEISGRKDIHIIPDGIDIDKYKPAERNIKIPSKYKINNEKIVFFTGNMIERKGHRYLLEAMKYIKNERSNIKLILGGKGPLFDEIFDLRKELDLDDIVIMPGFIPDDEIIQLLQSVDLYVLPSCIDKNGDTEGSATAALEAMACGTPAIVSKVGGNIGAIFDGKGAYYCKPANVKNLAKKILHLLEDEKLHKERRKKARIFVSNNYSWEIIINKYIKLLMA